MIEISATIFGLLQGLFVMLNKRCNWIFYVIQMALMVVFSVQNHLYGDTVNSSIYIIIGMAGWFLWGKETGTKVEKASMTESCIYLSVIIIGTIAVRTWLVGTDDPLPALDAFTTVTSFVATILMVRHKIDTWIIWFVNDIAYCVEYWLLPDQALYLLGLNVVWTVMAIGSFIIWYKEMKKTAA